MKKIMIAGTHSGCGKTTVTCAVLQALVNRKINVTAFKCGPDYIDPMFHRTVIGAPSYNLDSYLMSEDKIRLLMNKNGKEVSVIEGVMGFYDGYGVKGLGSSYEMSRITGTPVVLVVDCRGAGMSALAMVKGFKELYPNNIQGVIFNNLSEKLYRQIAAERRRIGITPIGFLPHDDALRIESRHLGLTTAQEIDNIKEKLRILADYAEKYINMDLLLQIMAAGDAENEKMPRPPYIGDTKIAVARDRAFCFYYEDNLALLREMGAQIIEFSPLKNEEVPECDGIILGGGYPELYAAELEKNTGTIKSLKGKIQAGTPCIAECGGFMYLHEVMEDNEGIPHKMVGIIKGRCRRTKSLRRFGYMEMTANSDNILCKRGEKIRAREFHYFDSDNCGEGFTACREGARWQCVVTEKNLFAGFPHLHFWTDARFAENFLKSCEEYKCTR